MEKRKCKSYNVTKPLTTKYFVKSTAWFLRECRACTTNKHKPFKIDCALGFVFDGKMVCSSCNGLFDTNSMERARCKICTNQKNTYKTNVVESCIDCGKGFDKNEFKSREYLNNDGMLITCYSDRCKECRQKQRDINKEYKRKLRAELKEALKEREFKANPIPVGERIRQYNLETYGMECVL